MTSNAPETVVQIGGAGGITPEKLDAYRAFVEFYAMPDPDKAAMFDIPKDPKTGRYERTPTLGDFAKKYGVHRNTLTLWKQREDFVAAVDLKQKQWGLDLVPNVMASLYRRCVKYGISTDVELFLAYYKNWDRKQVIKHLTERFDMDDIRALLAPLPKEDQEKFYGILSEIIAKAEILGGSSQVSSDLPVIAGNDTSEVRA